MTTALTTAESLVAVVAPNPAVRVTGLWTVAALQGSGGVSLTTGLWSIVTVTRLTVPTQLATTLMALLAVVQVPPQIGFTPRPFFMMME